MSYGGSRPRDRAAAFAFEVFDSNAKTSFQTTFDVGDALDAALRLVGRPCAYSA